MKQTTQNYLITGGSSGIGLAIATRLAKDNSRVILVSGNKGKLESAVRTLDGKDHLIFNCDLSDLARIEEIFSFLSANHIKLNGMVHSAGIAPLCLVKDNTPELMEKVFRVNFFAFIELVKYFQVEKVSHEGSKIVVITSILAQGSGYRQTLYGASKAALVASARLMAKELMNRRIHVNCLSPGVVNTTMLNDLRAKSVGLDEKIKTNQPLGIIPPENVANAVMFLLSEGSDFLTGAEWVLDGGALLK